MQILLPFNTKKLCDKILIVNRLGSWAFINQHEYQEINKGDINEELKEKLEYAGLLLSENNIGRVIQDFRNLNANLFQGPSLHIISVSTVCNYNCVYCHASSPVNKNIKLDSSTASKILEFIFNANSKAITVEFQGGEPLTNWPIISKIIADLRRINEIEKKDLRISIVSNLSLMDDNKLNFLLDNEVSICSSLDGPKELHDYNRPFVGGEGTYDLVTRRIRHINEVLSSRKKSPMNALPTITRKSLNYPKQIVEEYAKLGLRSIHLRYMNYLGVAISKWEQIGYKAEEFADFWKKGVENIIELNKKGIYIEERMSVIILTKILAKKDPMYTELMSPCGAGRTQIVYTENGDVYTCDEGRMLNSDLFKMGNVLTSTYNEVMSGNTIHYAAVTSLMDLYTPTDAYTPWMGTCPVVNTSSQGNCVSKIYINMRHKIHAAQFDFIFEKLLNDKEARQVFANWVGVRTEAFEKYL